MQGRLKNFCKKVCQFKKKIYLCSPKPCFRDGSLAQLVQSVCLTSRGSGVRIPQLPLNDKADESHSNEWLFICCRLRQFFSQEADLYKKQPAAYDKKYRRHTTRRRRHMTGQSAERLSGVLLLDGDFTPKQMTRKIPSR